MGLFFIHIIKSSLCLVFFYPAYKVLLSKETFYKVNRFILLVIIIASAIIPFFELAVSEPAVVTVPAHLKNIENLILQRQVHFAGFTADAGDGFYSLLFFIYITGVLVQLIITIANFARIYRLAHRATKLSYGEYTLAVTRQEQSPFSWGRYIVLSKTDYSNQPEIIIQHELIHLKRHHSIDLLLAELAIIVFWFNPTIWLLKKEMKDIHEFEVDETLINQGVDAKEYQLLLIRKAVGEKLYSVANTFNQSSISKRIMMMLRKRSNPWAQLKYICIIVLTLFSVIAFARPDVTNKLKGISSDKLGKFIKKQVAVVSTALKPEKTIAAEKKATTGHPVMANINPPPATESPVQNNEVVKSESSPLCIVNGRETSYAEFERIIPESIKSVKVLKEREAIIAYGAKGKNGVIEITLNSIEITASDIFKILKQPAGVSERVVINNSQTTTTEPGYVFFIGGKLADPQQQLVLSANKLLLFQNNHDEIESTISITGKAATDKYGPDCKNGVVEIYLKDSIVVKK